MITPGEWIYFDDVESPFWGEIRSAETFDVIAHQVDGDDRTEDFKLMAAAPELLAACELAYNLLNGGSYAVSSTRADVVELLNTAIAKAKGETNE